MSLSHTTEEATDASTPKPGLRWWQRLVVYFFLGLCVFSLFGFSYFLLERSLSTRKIDNLETRLDESEPGWRFEEIEAARRVIPDHRNSALLIQKLSTMLGKSAPDATFAEWMQSVDPPALLDESRLTRLKTEVARQRTVLDAAMPLADMPFGRFKLDYQFNPLRTLLPEVQNTRQIAQLLRYQLIAQANKGEISPAIRSARAILCVGRSLYDEPFPVSQLVRAANVHLALSGVEYALSLGQSSDEELQLLDKILADEEKQNAMLIAMRGERAMMYQFLTRLAAGAITMAPLYQDFGVKANWLERSEVYPAWQARRAVPKAMEALNEWVEIAQLPPHEQPSREAAAGKMGSESLAGVTVLNTTQGDHTKTGLAMRRKTAQVSCLRIVLAAERYRMKHGRLPSTVAPLVPEFLKAEPLDPFDGKSIRLVPFADGLTVYSVGPDGIDNGGKIDRERPIAPGTDLGYQLWDAAKRRQVASEVEKKRSPQGKGRRARP